MPINRTQTDMRRGSASLRRLAVGPEPARRDHSDVDIGSSLHGRRSADAQVECQRSSGRSDSGEEQVRFSRACRQVTSLFEAMSDATLCHHVEIAQRLC